jgi:two-component system osmolarity sensor histidine kinase EnvZ
MNALAAIKRYRRAAGPLAGSVSRCAALPTGALCRSLLIIIAPMVLLQSVIAFVFMERHWQTVTQRLSSAVSRDIATLIDVYRDLSAGRPIIPRSPASRASGWAWTSPSSLPGTDLPAPGTEAPSSRSSTADPRPSSRQQVKRPFWIDTVGRSICRDPHPARQQRPARLPGAARPMPPTRHIFLLWMVGTSLMLTGIAILFLRGQIRPILKLAEAAESFGKGRDAGFPAARRRRGAPRRQSPSSR